MGEFVLKIFNYIDIFFSVTLIVKYFDWTPYYINEKVFLLYQ